MIKSFEKVVTAWVCIQEIINYTIWYWERESSPEIADSEWKYTQKKKKKKKKRTSVPFQKKDNEKSMRNEKVGWKKLNIKKKWDAEIVA